MGHLNSKPPPVAADVDTCPMSTTTIITHAPVSLSWDTQLCVTQYTCWYSWWYRNQWSIHCFLWLNISWTSERMLQIIEYLLIDLVICPIVGSMLFTQDVSCDGWRGLRWLSCVGHLSVRVMIYISGFISGHISGRGSSSKGGQREEVCLQLLWSSILS